MKPQIASVDSPAVYYITFHRWNGERIYSCPSAVWGPYETLEEAQLVRTETENLHRGHDYATKFIGYVTGNWELS